jgi:DNA helicase-2/ATP-dependent DNA helicase PcrA
VRAAGPRPTVTEYDSEEDEARQVGVRLQEAWTADRRWSDLAVLYRTNAQSAAFEAALSAVGIPFRVRGAGSFLDRPEVRAALDRLRDAARDAPGRSFAEHLVDLDVVDAAAGDERSEHGDALVRLGREYLDAESGSGSLDGFLAFLTAALRDDAPIDEDAVELLTFHRAKGLEFHTVFVTGLERGLVPISYADTPPERAEERRLLYVALSRAELALHCSWARSRTFGLRTARRSPSPWLEPIASALRGGPSDAPARPASAGVRTARARLAAVAGEPTTAGAELFAALRDWRRGLARASGVPAYVIFPDSTLRAVAESRPATSEDLLALPGVGPVKAARHGEAVLQLVRSHT